MGGLEVWSADGWTGATTNNAVAPMIGQASSGATDYTPTVAVVGGKVSYAGGIATIDDDSMGLWDSYGVVVSAVDVNGNASARAAISSARPTSDAAAQIPAAPFTPTLLSATSNSVDVVAGSYHTNGAPAYFRVIYREAITFSTVLQIDHIAPVTILPDMTLFTVTLPGLRTEATYEVWAAAANSNDWPSVYSGPLRFVATNGVDANSNRMPDDWESAYGVGSLPFDYDRDGLSNLSEYHNMTHPRLQDSDGDGFSDQEEVISDPNPLDRAFYPASYIQPRLRLDRNRVNFYFKQGVKTYGTAHIAFYNDGGGELTNLAASETAPWLTAGMLADSVSLVANADSLAPGVYDTVVRVYRTAGSNIGKQQCIRMRLYLLPADDDYPRYDLYLPLVMRAYTPPQWEFTLVDPNGDAGQHTSVAIDPRTGIPYISYYDAVNGNLRMVNPVGYHAGNCGPDVSWRCEVVKTTDDVGKYSSIAIWDGGSVWKIGIAYYNDTTDSLEYAEYIEGTWTWTFTVVNAGNRTLNIRDGQHASLKFDAAGIPHIAYFTFDPTPMSTDALRYAHYVGGSAGNCGETHWACESIERGDGVGRHAILDLDDSNRPHIAYYDGGNNLLRYARLIGGGNGNRGPDNNWQCDTSETATAPDGDERLIGLNAISLNEAQIAYNAVIDATPTLRYARTTPGAYGPDNTWTCISITENVDGIALETTSAVPFIAYHDLEADALAIARPIALNTFGNCGPVLSGKIRSWQCDVLDDGGARDVGAYPSIALNNSGLAIIAYYDATNKDLWAALQQY